MPRRLVATVALLALGSLAPCPTACADGFDDDVLVQLEELGSPSAADRKAAEAALAELATSGPGRADRVLQLLPEPKASIPPDVQAAIDRVRIRIQSRIAESATAASRVTIQVAQAPLAEVLAEFSRQTGVTFRDNREAFGGEAVATPVTLTLEDEPFWSAVDELLDATDLSVYPYGDEGELTLIARGEEERRRTGAAAYSGPFRFEPLRVSATRGLRDENESRLDLVVEASWEPRLRPVALSQPVGELTITGSDGEQLFPRMPNQSIDLEATPGEQALSMTLSMVLPKRKVERIEKVSGRLSAIVPATAREFKVENIGAAELPVVQQFGDATVTVTRFRKVNEIWELHMRLAFRDAGEALASHRGWVFQNKSYLVDPDGKKIENAGFETTMQGANEVGLAYLFDLSGGQIYGFGFDDLAADDGEDEKQEEADPKTLTWVYETATGVYTVPVKWELGPIDLP